MDTVVKSMLEEDEQEQKKSDLLAIKTLYLTIILLPVILLNNIVTLPVYLIDIDFILPHWSSLFTIVVFLPVKTKDAGLMIFGRDVSKIPCFRESFLYGVATGTGMGLATFLKTSKPLLSQHVGVGSFSLATMIYWSYCRYCWSQQRFDAQLLQDALKDKILYEGTAVEKELEQKGVLKSV